MRERLGMNRKALADRIGVPIKSVTFWEDPESRRYPPEEAWNMLDEAIEHQRDIVAKTLDKISELVNENGIWPSSVRLPYWLSINEFEQSNESGPGYDWNMANANARMTEIVLETMGIGVDWVDLNPYDQI